MATIRQIYTGCLAQGAYYLESEGEAVVIDPLRETEPYIEMAKSDNARIKYIFETHFHADFVSGHIDLAQKTGAEIVYGPTTMSMGFQATVAEDGQEFRFGKATIKVLHTPGHTLESSCFLLRDEAGKDVALFTGDTLFIGDVGRPDLAQKVIADLTPEKLAGYLYDSLREKIMPLADDIVVYPAHGAGSACGKKMSKETSDTLGGQKRSNYALREGLTKEGFIQELLTGLTPPPAYFPQNVLLNIKGYENIDKVMKRGTTPLSPRAFEAAANETGAVVIDTRPAEAFAQGFIPNSINIGLNGSFAVWVGTLIPDVKQEILIVAEAGREEETIKRLARVGYDCVVGYLDGGFERWAKEGNQIDLVKNVTAEELAELQRRETVHILDVRKASEFDSERIVGAQNAPLDYVNDSMATLDKNKTYYVHCATGYRSVTFISILQARGFENLVNVLGGFVAMKQTGNYAVSDYVHPTTLL